jgi:hypothetical protein
LCSLLLALEKHVQFVEKNESDSTDTYASLLSSLMSSRPDVLSEALIGFPLLRSRAIIVLHKQFMRFGNAGTAKNAHEVAMEINCSSKSRDVNIPVQLLKSLSMLLSIWCEKDDPLDSAIGNVMNEIASALLVDHITLIDSSGLASATLVKTGELVVSIESVRLACSTERVGLLASSQ